MLTMPLPYKGRTEPKSLLFHRLLNKREALTKDTQKYYINQEKGFQGEVQFDALTEKLESNCYILNDLQLEVNNTSFQIDTVINFEGSIYVLDVKNYEGEFLYASDIFRTANGKEIKNPLNQLQKTQSMFRQLLQSLGLNFNVEAFIIFINPEFTLHQAPMDLPFIYPTKLNRFLKQLNSQPSRLNKHQHKKLADKLVSMHKSVPPYLQIPPYQFDKLKKGITCKNCYSFSVVVIGNYIVCDNCGYKEKVAYAVLRNIEEFKILFPEKKITTILVYEWCGVIHCQKRICRILNRHFKKISSGRHAYYIDK
jgi:hypothetical protein